MIRGKTSPTNSKREFRYEIEKDIDELRDVSIWPHRPIYLQADKKTMCDDERVERDGPLPIGEEIHFETDLFKGKILFRIRNIVSNVPKDHTEYFKGKQRYKHISIQGRFKKRFKFSDVWYGDVYEKPQNIPRIMSKLIYPIFQYFSPGVVMDFSSKEPNKQKIIVVLAGDAQTISINTPGEEPDITNPELPENTTLLGIRFDTIDERRSQLKKYKIASQFEYNPNLVYTFGMHDKVIDIKDFSIAMGGKMVSMAKSMNGNPIGISLLTSDNESIFRFRIFHELLVSYKKNDEVSK